MDSIEHDVVICSDEQGFDLVRTIAAGLTRRGFRVCPVEEGTAAAAARLPIIEQAPDFVLLLTARGVNLLRDPNSAISWELSQALATERNIVPVYAPGLTMPADDESPAAIAALEKRQPIGYRERVAEESIARIARRLSSDASVEERHMLRQAKWIGSFTGLVLVALTAVAVVGVASRMLVRHVDVRPLPPFALRWSAFGQRNDNGRWVEFAVREGIPGASGDQLRLAFSPAANGYAYVVSRDVGGNIEVLFPARHVKAASRVNAGQVYEAPADGSWLTADDASGLDRVYVIASYDPIENLESLIDERDEEATTARGAFLDATIAGLLDGRHAGATGRVRTRSGRPIADNVRGAAAATSASLATVFGAASFSFAIASASTW